MLQPFFRHPHTTLVTLLLLAMLFVLACGAAAPPAPAEKPAPKEVPKEVVKPVATPIAVPTPTVVPKQVVAPTATPAPTPVPKVAKPAGTINVGQKETGRFVIHPRLMGNPQIFVSSTAPIVEGLFAMNFDGKVVGLLARSWTISPDYLTWTFNLQRGVQFHKGYGEMTAEDVVWSMREWSESKLHPRSAGIKEFWQPPKGSVETPDPYTVVVNTGVPKPFIVEVRSMTTPGGGATFITSKKQSDKLGAEAASTDAAGTGPWEIVEHRTGEFWKMRAVEGHWRKTPHFAELVFWEIPEESTRIAGFQTGQLDTFLMAFDSISIVEKVPGTKFISVPNAIEMGLRFYGQYYLDLGTAKQRPAYDPKLPWVSANPDINSPEWERARKVRLALVTAIDRQTIVETVLRGYAHIKTPLRGWTGFEHQLEARNWEFNPDKAKKLLAEAGYSKGFSITLTPALRGAPAEVEACELVATMWTAIGIDVKFQRIPYSTLRPPIVGRTYQGATCHAGSPILTPAYGFGSQLAKNPFSRGIEHPWLEEKMTQAMAIIDDKDRARAEAEVGNFMFHHVTTDIALYNMDAVWPVGPRLEEWQQHVNVNDLRNINGYEYIRPRKQQ